MFSYSTSGPVYPSGQYCYPSQMNVIVYPSGQYCYPSQMNVPVYPYDQYGCQSQMSRPMCQYGQYCYQMDKDHWQNYNHPERGSQTKIRLFHGTSLENARSISAHGWRLSIGGRLGPGIYFTVQHAAAAIARNRGNGNNGAVIEVEIDVGHVNVLTGYQEDRSGVWYSQGYHACKTMHPAWRGIGIEEFPEWCVRDLSRVRIVSIR